MLSKGKTHVYRQVHFILILNLSLGQCGFTIETPVHRFQTTIHIAFVQNFAECANFIRLIGKIHGFVRIVPFAQNAQTHEIHFLRFDLLGGIGTGFFLHFARR